MGRRPSRAYAPKAPAQSVLYRIVRNHFETFRLETAQVHERDSLPGFIEEEFVLDGVYAEDGRTLRWHEAAPPTEEELDRIARWIAERMTAPGIDTAAVEPRFTYLTKHQDQMRYATLRTKGLSCGSPRCGRTSPPTIQPMYRPTRDPCAFQTLPYSGHVGQGIPNWH